MSTFRPYIRIWHDPVTGERMQARFCFNCHERMTFNLALVRNQIEGLDRESKRRVLDYCPWCRDQDVMDIAQPLETQNDTDHSHNFSLD